MLGFRGNLFSTRKAPGRKPTFKPRCEALERRDLMSAVVHPVPVTGVHNNNGSVPPAPTAAGLALLSGLPATPARAAALADYQRDGYLSRNDMLDILNRGTDDYARATPDEITGLETLVNHGATVGMPGYVQNLASKTVAEGAAHEGEYRAVPEDGVDPKFWPKVFVPTPSAAAQALHQGANNWFLGQAHPDASYVYYGKVVHPSYGPVDLPLWKGSPSYQDVAQGFEGDCWLMASLAEVAARNPGDIEGMFIDNGDGTYTVRFYHGGTPDYVTVDKWLPSGGFLYDHPQGDLWAALAEKAYAQENAAGRVGSGHPGVGSYQALFGGRPQWALSAITGLVAHSWGGADPYTVFAEWSQGSFVVLSTGDSPDSSLVTPDHAYALVNYSHGSFTLFNPWGLNSTSYPGLINVPGGVLGHNFNFRDVAGAAAPQAITAGAPAPVAAARQVTGTLTVTNALDSGPGSLRAAVIQANSDAARGRSDTITFAGRLKGKTITLRSTLELTAGQGTAYVYIDGKNNISLSGGNRCGLFSVDSGAHLELENLVLEDGHSTAGGGAVFNAGTLGLGYDCTLRDNSSTYAGGAVYNSSTGTLSVGLCTFQHNGCTGGAGGAIDNLGTAYVNYSAFSGNWAKWGGAIENGLGSTTVNSSAFSGNSASQDGGAIDSELGDVFIDFCAFNSNFAVHDGGAVSAVLTKLDAHLCAFNSNNADSGGAIKSGYGCKASVRHSNLSENHASHFGGAIDNEAALTLQDSGFDKNSADYGGAVCNHGAGAAMADSGCLFLGNSASVAGSNIDYYRPRTA
jgi:predicted outer membrane repeat protein